MSRTPTRDTSVRKERIPVSSQRAPLRYKGLDHKNFVHRWVLDRDDRIAMFLDAGYDFVTPTEHGTKVGEPTVDSSSGTNSNRVTKSAGFGSLRLILMRIPREFYEEDQAKKQLEVDASEESMRHPKTGQKAEGVDYGRVTFSRTKTLPVGTE